MNEKLTCCKRLLDTYRKTNGITLVALVVTIVVLVILAVISINAVFGNNGIINRAEEAKVRAAQATENDLSSINSLYDNAERYLNGNNDEENQLPSTDETKPYLPTGFSKVEETDLNSGLVIQDENGNQYVWVEVPKSLYENDSYNSKDTTADQKPNNSADYDKIEYCLQQYSITYRNGTNYTDTYYADSDNIGWFANEEEYNDLKHKMLKSVYENGGFYVGRYETGIMDAPRTSAGETTGITPVIKADAYPYNYVTRTQAQVLATNMYSSDIITSSIMFGVQWDLVLKYLEVKAVEKGATLATIQEELNGPITGSTNWGNCGDSEFNITNTNAKYVIYHAGSETMGNWEEVPADYTKPRSYENEDDVVLLTTGANEIRNSKQNICDLAGNVLEWTLEYATTSSPCTSRGGNYYYYGYDNPASVRRPYNTNNSSDFWGFRVSLY